MDRIANLVRGGDPFADLNAAQREAVEHNGGPLLVIAGAGSGKTKTLSCRVARLLKDGADPHRILMLTFSRRAAADMIRRVGAAAAVATGVSSDIQMPWAGTFHAVGAKLLREFAPFIGLSADFSIHDRGDSADLMGLVRHDLGFDQSVKRFPTKSTCLAIYSRATNAEEALGDVLADYFPWCRAWQPELAKLFAAYVGAKQQQGVLDYDDLLFYWAEAMAEPTLAQEVGDRFDHILVDEYQDTNRLQSRILLSIRPSGRGVTVVGDDAQSIYSFRAATVRNILDFPQSYEPAARIVTLEENYRSTGEILQASNAVISLAQERFTKNLRAQRTGGAKPKIVTVRDDADQARYVADEILAAREMGHELKSQAVLFRASDASTQLELELQRRDIPFVKYGGLKFLEAAHIKDVLAILRWTQNQADRIAAFRALQLAPGIGPTKAGKVVDACTSVKLKYALGAITPSAEAASIWAEYVSILTSCSDRGNWPADMDRIAAWYEPVLQARYDDAASRRGDIAQLQRIASAYPSRDTFLTDLTLDPPSGTTDNNVPPTKDDDFLILSTIHSAKGQEWRNVFVLNASDGSIPADLGVGSQADIEEERRLLYVAMTRAKESLQLMVPQKFYVPQQRKNGDKHVYGIRTRFIPPELLIHFEEVSWPTIKDTESRARSAPLPSVDLSSRARARWAVTR